MWTMSSVLKSIFCHISHSIIKYKCCSHNQYMEDLKFISFVHRLSYLFGPTQYHTIILDKELNWDFTWWDWNQISHFPGMNLSGMRSAYRQAPVTYKAPISNAWYKAPWSMTCLRPYILIKWIIGAAEMNPNATNVDALNDRYSCKIMN